MEEKDRELVRRLVEEDEAFRDLYRTHKDYETRISSLESKHHLTPEETVERNKLKKLKLSIKEDMEKILAKHRL